MSNAKTITLNLLRSAGYIVLRGFVYLIDKRDEYRIAAGKDPILPQ